MSSAAILIQSSSAAMLQSRCFPCSAVASKECWWCSSNDDKAHHLVTCLSFKAGLRLQTGEADGSPRANRSVVMRAGLGRYAGAVHGNSQGKSRSRRRPPLQQDDQEQCDEHQDGISGSDGSLPKQGEEHKSGQSTDEAKAECEAFAAEGTLHEDKSSNEKSQQLSYNRYLQEMGVTFRPQESDEFEEKFRDSLRILDGSSSDDDTSHFSDGALLNENEATSQAVTDGGGQGEDLSYEGTKEMKAKTATDAKRGRGENMGMSDDVVEEIEKKREDGTMSEDKTPPVAESMLSTPDQLHETPILNKDEAFRIDLHEADMVSKSEIAGKELRPVGEGGGPMKKKRRTKVKSKAAVDTSLKFGERSDNERVRASTSEAERPAIPSEKELQEVLPINGSVVAFKETESAEPKIHVGADEEPEKEPISASSSVILEVAESTNKDVQSSIPVDSVVHSNSMIATSIEEISPDTPNVEGTPLTTLGKAGAVVISEPSVAADDGAEQLMLSRTESVVREQPAQIGSAVVETVLEQAVQTVGKVVPLEIVETAAQVASKVVELPAVVVEQAAQVGGQVVDILPDAVTEQVSQVVDQVSDFAEQVVQVVDVVSDVAEQVANSVNEQVEQVAESVSNTASQVAEHVEQVAESVSSTASQVVEHVEQVAESVSNTASQVVEHVEQVAESVSSTASQVAEHVSSGVDNVASTASAVVDQVTEFFSSDDDESDSDDEFEAYMTSDLPEFRGKRGLSNFIIKQEDQGILSKIYDIYTYMLKQSFPNFAAAMFCTPIIVSGVFTLLYLPEFEGLAFDDTARDFFGTGGDSPMLHLSWKTLFQVFMFSLSLSTGLQPELAPLTPYTLVVANLNALVAQLVFVFLSGAVFARLSQPSQPLRCSSVALVSTSPAQRRRKENGIKVFMARYVLAGPQPCELVDVKVDLTYKYNTLTRTGSFFRATQSLKLVRPEIAFLTHGMLVRHVIDETSPLYQRTPEMLKKEDAIFCLSVVGLERASMQSVFHVQHYCVVDNDVVWNAEFEDIILINKKNRRVVDHSRLSMWRPLIP